jgi:PIN domain nuclease of toxin-antitoxin system
MKEPGAEVVEAYLGNTFISTANLQEVIVPLVAGGLPAGQIDRLI